MSDPSDLSAQLALIGNEEDDRRFKREKQRKSMPKVELATALPDGPCCARCAHWTPPRVADGFGHCGKLVVVTERVRNGPERGHVFGIDDALSRATYPWDFFKTRGPCEGCSQFKSLVKLEAA